VNKETGESFAFPFDPIAFSLIVALHCIACRRDSFITHRAFCDALTEESAKAIGGMPVMAQGHHHAMLYSPPPHQLMQQQHQELAVFQDQQQEQHCNYAVKPEMQPWPSMPYEDVHHRPLLQPICTATAQSSATSAPAPTQQQLPAAAAHLSATALLQKAAQMGATIGGAGAGGTSPHYTQMAGAATSAAGSATFGLGLSCLNSQQMMTLARTASHGRGAEDGSGGGATGGANDGMTRDFLGLRAFSHRDILGLAGFDSSCMGAAVNTAANNASLPPCFEQQQHGQSQPQQQQHSTNEPWHGMSSHS
jgi:hypothetical protein